MPRNTHTHSHTHLHSWTLARLLNTWTGSVPLSHLLARSPHAASTHRTHTGSPLTGTHACALALIRTLVTELAHKGNARRLTRPQAHSRAHRERSRTRLLAHPLTHLLTPSPKFTHKRSDEQAAGYTGAHTLAPSGTWTRPRTNSPPTLALSGVARAVGTQGPVGRGAGQGTELTVGSPAPATPAAALGPRDGLTAAQLSLAHGLQHLGEAGPLADVCGERVSMVGGRNCRLGPFPRASAALRVYPDVSDMLCVGTAWNPPHQSPGPVRCPPGPVRQQKRQTQRVRGWHLPAAESTHGQGQHGGQGTLGRRRTEACWADSGDRAIDDIQGPVGHGEDRLETGVGEEEEAACDSGGLACGPRLVLGHRRDGAWGARG